MTRAEEAICLAYLQEALASPISGGIELTLIDADAARNLRARLYALRRDHPEYQEISFAQRGASGEKLQLIHRGTDPDFIE